MAAESNHNWCQSHVKRCMDLFTRFFQDSEREHHSSLHHGSLTEWNSRCVNSSGPEGKWLRPESGFMSRMWSGSGNTSILRLQKRSDIVDLLCFEVPLYQFYQWHSCIMVHMIVVTWYVLPPAGSSVCTTNTQTKQTFVFKGACPYFVYNSGDVWGFLSYSFAISAISSDLYLY